MLFRCFLGGKPYGWLTAGQGSGNKGGFGGVGRVHDSEGCEVTLPALGDWTRSCYRTMSGPIPAPAT